MTMPSPVGGNSTIELLSAHLALAKAESAHHLADLYKSKPDLEQLDARILASRRGLCCYRRQAEREFRRLPLRHTCYIKQGVKKSKAVALEEQILSVTTNSEDVRPHFIADLAIAELLDGTGEVDGAQSALNDAETLVGPDITLPHVEPGSLVELY